MKIKTSELTDAALDWMVAISKGIPAEELYIQKRGSRLPPSIYRRNRDEDGNLDGSYTTGPDLLFSRKWEAGGPIIDMAAHNLFKHNGGTEWCCACNVPRDGYTAIVTADGPTPLIAAMRCYVASELGDEVDVPEELA